ncbi:MAG: adenylate/guanylate cyclase domain-containing protein [Chloroflexi bacterium]|nr:adenylate/guanylate cyclase domain-containing protein [Chloroflexota bacterium]
MLASASWTEFIPTGLGTILLLVAGSTMSARRSRLYPRWFDKLLAGLPVNKVPPEARREVLQYPLWAMITSLTMWLIAAVTFGLLLSGSGRAFVGIFMVGGFFTSIAVYFAVELIWRNVIPVYYPDGGVRGVNVFRVPILQRLLAIFFLVSVYPLGMVVLLSLDRARKIILSDDPAFYMRNMLISEIFIFFVTALVTLILALLVTRSIVDPLADLQEAMQRVKANDLDVSIPTKSNDEFGYVTEHFNDMAAGLRRGELLRNLLNVYVSPEVARQAVEHGTQLGGQLVECTVLFSDLRSFTSLSETLPPDDLIALLNRYMEAMVSVIVSRGGVVNKFGGDSLLAVFGTPLNPSEEHASSAVRAAFGMRDALVEFNRRQKDVKGPQLQCGIAVATGKVVAGNVGGRERIEYTVIGDTVNLAARLQAMSKELRSDIILNAEAYTRAKAEMNLEAQGVPNVHVRGKVESVTIYVV